MRGPYIQTPTLPQAWAFISLAHPIFTIDPPHSKSQHIMPGPINTLLIDGSFEELAEELAHYIDEIRKKNGEESSNIQGEVSPLLEQGQQDEVLKKLVTGSSALNKAPEKGMFWICPKAAVAYCSLLTVLQNSLPLTTSLSILFVNLPTSIASSPKYAQTFRRQ